MRNLWRDFFTFMIVAAVLGGAYHFHRQQVAKNWNTVKVELAGFNQRDNNQLVKYYLLKPEVYRNQPTLNDPEQTTFGWDSLNEHELQSRLNNINQGQVYIKAVQAEFQNGQVITWSKSLGVHLQDGKVVSVDSHAPTPKHEGAFEEPVFSVLYQQFPMSYGERFTVGFTVGKEVQKMPFSYFREHLRSLDPKYFPVKFQTYRSGVPLVEGRVDLTTSGFLDLHV